MSYDLDGSTNYLTLPVSNSWEFTNNVLICGIVRIDSFTNDNTVAVWGENGVSGYALFVRSTSGNLAFNKNGVAAVNGTATTALSINTWYAVMGHSSSGGAGTFRRYNLETKVMASETPASTGAINIPTDDPGVIGRWLTAVSYLNGKIACVALYNRAAFSESEFRMWAHSYGRMPTSSRPVGYWPLYNSPVDLSGNAINATLVSGTVADGPPSAGVPFGFDLGWQGAFTAAAAGGVSIPIAAYHYNHHLGSMAS